MKRYMKGQARKMMGNSSVLPVNKLFAPFFSGIGTIVMFHRVIPDTETPVFEEMEVTVGRLEKIISYFIDKGYEIISIDQAYEVITGKRKMDRKFVVFTFDDGYLDNFTLAYPLFRKYNAPFTIYITTSFPDKTAFIWWYALKELLNRQEDLQFQYGDKEYHFELHSKNRKITAYEDLRRLILSADEIQQKRLFRELFTNNEMDLQHFSSAMSLDWDQIREMTLSGLVTIGAHTTNHKNLKKLDPQTAKKEMLDSKLRIESLIGEEVSHFSFPYGSRNEAGKREFAIAEELLFKTSTTTRCGNIFQEHSGHTSCLPRITPSPYLIEAFPQFYASGFIPALRQKFKRVVTI